MWSQGAKLDAPAQRDELIDLLDRWPRRSRGPEPATRYRDMLIAGTGRFDIDELGSQSGAIKATKRGAEEIRQQNAVSRGFTIFRYRIEPVDGGEVFESVSLDPREDAELQHALELNLWSGLTRPERRRLLEQQAKLSDTEKRQHRVRVLLANGRQFTVMVGPDPIAAWEKINSVAAEQGSEVTLTHCADPAFSLRLARVNI